MKLRKFLKLILFILAFHASYYLVVLHKPNGNELTPNKLTNITLCGRYPSKDDIAIDNKIWQILEMPKGSLKLLNAYLDTRHNERIVRVNANGVKLDIKKDKIFCQFWFDESSDPIVIKSSEYLLLWYESWGLKADDKRPYLISCPLPNVEGKLPTSVSLTNTLCGKATNIFPFIDNQPVDGFKDEFGVCTRPLAFDSKDSAMRFIEWVHLLKILGASEVNVYINSSIVEFNEILDLLEQEKLVKRHIFINPSNVSEGRTQQKIIEMNALNDCFYRVRNLYDYVVILDPDEVIMPVKESDNSWHDMLLNNFDMSMKYDSLCAESVYYPRSAIETFDDIPKYHIMLQRIQRSAKFSKLGSDVKSFIVPERIVAVSSQYSFFCYVKLCNTWSMPTDVAQKSHYEDVAVNATISDKTIWKFKDELIDAVQKTLETANFTYE